MAIDKYVVFLIMELFAFAGMVNAQSHNGMISLAEVRIPGTITTGTYSQLVELLGMPASSFTSTINPIRHKGLKKRIDIAPKDTVQCEYLEYGAYEYLRVGDSVQLVFVDLRKSKSPVYINDMVITPKITQKNFLLEIKERGWWSEDSSQYKVGGIEYHYYTHSKVKNFGVDCKEGPYSSVVFTFYDRLFDKRIWWIEFPIMRIGGIVH